MKYLKYSFITIASSAIFWATACWIVAPTLDAISITFLKGNPAKYLVWAILLIFAGLLNAYVKRNAGCSEHRPSLRAQKLWLALTFIGMIIIVCAAIRITLPFVGSVVGMNVPKVMGSAFLAWWMVLFFGYTCYKLGELHLFSTRNDIESRRIPKALPTMFPSAEDVLANDSRPPILYLRSFNKELAKAQSFYYTSMRLRSLLSRKSGTAAGNYLFSSRRGKVFVGKRSILRALVVSQRSMFDEQMLFADVFSKVGPYIAIGRPNQNFRNLDLGAAKKYVPDEEWQEVVGQWIRASAAVVLEAGDTDGLSWEMDQIVKQVDPLKLLIIMPFEDDEYDAFRMRYKAIFPKALPQQRPTSRLVIFDRDWQPRELPNIHLTVGLTLQPFFEQNGFETAIG